MAAATKWAELIEQAHGDHFYAAPAHFGMHYPYGNYAYHEAGHAVVMHRDQPGAINFIQMTPESDGSAQALVDFDDDFGFTADQLLLFYLAGTAAEWAHYQHRGMAPMGFGGSLDNAMGFVKWLGYGARDRGENDNDFAKALAISEDWTAPIETLEAMFEQQPTAELYAVTVLGRTLAGEYGLYLGPNSTRKIAGKRAERIIELALAGYEVPAIIPQLRADIERKAA